jgi:choline monooxygenase
MSATLDVPHRSPLDRAAQESVLRPTAEARGLPNEAYTDAAFLARERDTLFARTWTCVGFVSDLEPGGYARPVDLVGLPLLITRDARDAVRVFHNVCSHRGHKLVSEPCPAGGMMSCPYHAWSYALDGRLEATPHIGGPGVHELEGFDRARHGLKPVRSEVWLGMVFVNLSGDAPPFDQHIQPLAERWEAFYGAFGPYDLRPAATGGALRIEILANWKLAVENYCESYHLPQIHPALNRYSRLEDHYHIMIGDDFAGQGTTVYDLAGDAGISLPRFEDWPEDRLQHAEYVSVYPNVLLGLQADHLFALILHPIAPDRTVEDLRIFYVGDEAIGTEYADARKATQESWRVVFAEDVGVVEGMQQGRCSPGFDGGVFSPVMDTPTHHFHRWAANSLAAG